MWRPAALFLLVVGCAFAGASNLLCEDESECGARNVEGSVLLQTQRHAAALQSVGVVAKDSNQSNRPIVILDFDTELDSDEKRCWNQPDVAGAVCTLCIGHESVNLGSSEDKSSLHKHNWMARCQDDFSKFVLQRDGNLVLYDKNNVPCWSSNTKGSGGQQLVFEVDGTLVLYDRSEPPHPLWQSPSWNCFQPTETEVLDSLSNPITAFDGKCWSHAIWTKETLNGRRRVHRVHHAHAVWSGYCRMCLQSDGNMVLSGITRSGRNIVAWASNTDSSGNGKTLHMQHDGNLVVYSPDQKPKSVSNTPGTSMAKLVFGNDGNLVLYDRDRQQSFWSSDTAAFCRMELLQHS